MRKNNRVKAGGVVFANDLPLAFIAGPCVIETEKSYAREAADLRKVFRAAGSQFVLKASFDKANRTSAGGFRGPGLERGLDFLRELKTRLGVPLLIDVHEPWQAERVAEVADVLQIPAFLCRQTDLLFAAADTGRTVNVKKGQFLSPWDVPNIVAKIESRGNRNIMLTERGSSFGYGNLVVDMRGLEVMKDTGYPVIFDCTHSVQRPGALGGATGGDIRFTVPLARAAAAVGVAGVFMEAHPEPSKALSDGPNSLRLAAVPGVIAALRAIDATAKKLKDTRI